MKLEQAFEEFMKVNPAKYQYGFASDNQTKIAEFVINASNGTFHSTCFFIEEEGILLVVVDTDIDVDMEDIEEVSEAKTRINQLNATTKLGHFYLEEELGGVFVKISQIIRGTEQEMIATVTDTILTGGVMANEGRSLL